jgi:hypothetical protein
MRVGVILHKTYLESEEDGENILNALNFLKIKYQIVDYNFNSFHDYKCEMKDIDIITCIGTISFQKKFPSLLKTTLPIHNLFGSDLHKFSCYQHYIPKNAMLNTNGIILPFHELKTRSSSFFKSMFGNKMFIRPNNTLKICEAELIYTEESSIDYWCRTKINFNKINNDDLFWIFNEKIIYNEYRTLVVNKKVITCSEYINNGEIISSLSNNDIFNNIKDFVESNNTLLNLYDDCYILDVANTSDGLKIIEINCAGCSGVYLLDKIKYFKNITSFISKIFD